jgi:hypothetical protein
MSAKGMSQNVNRREQDGCLAMSSDNRRAACSL